MQKKILAALLVIGLTGSPLEIQAQVEPPTINPVLLRDNKLIVWDFNPLTRPGIPRGRRKGAGSFSGRCYKDGTGPLLALVPKYASKSSDKLQSQFDNSTNNDEPVWVQTIDEYPTFWFYTPYTSKTSDSQTIKAIGELTITNSNSEKISKTLFALPEQPGVISIKLESKQGEDLKKDETYYWQLNIYCNLEEVSPSDWVSGEITRVKRTPEIDQQLAVAKAKEQEYIVYANNGLWYDTLTSLDTVKTKTKNPNLDEEWIELLKSNYLEEVAEQPVVHRYNGLE